LECLEYTSGANFIFNGISDVSIKLKLKCVIKVVPHLLSRKCYGCTISKRRKKIM